MKNSLRILKTEIEKELEGIDRLEYEMTEVLKHPDTTFLETRASGSILHDFYSAVEKIFRRIATKIDRDIPTGDDWHTDLLKRMTMPIDSIRPAVISEDLQDQLAEFLRFRHLFRNIYGFKLKWERCKALGTSMGKTLNLFKKEMAGFLEFIDSIKDIH